MTTALRCGVVGRAALLAISCLTTGTFLATPAHAASEPRDMRDMATCQRNNFCAWSDPNFEGKMQTFVVKPGANGDLESAPNSFYNHSQTAVLLTCAGDTIPLVAGDMIEELECAAGKFTVMRGDMTQPGGSETSEPGTGDMSQPGTGEMPQPGTGEMPQPGTGDISQSGISDTSQTGTGDASQSGTSDMSQSGTGDMVPPGLGDMFQSGTSETSEPSGTEFPQSGGFDLR